MRLLNSAGRSINDAKGALVWDKSRWYRLLAIRIFDLASGQPEPNLDIAPTGNLRAAMIGIRVLGGGVGEPIGRFIADRIGASFDQSSILIRKPTNRASAKANGTLPLARVFLLPPKRRM